MIKKRQHYVWRQYLRAWSEKDIIFCMRKNKIFQASLMNIAHEKYFYQLQELTLREKELINKIAIEPSPEILKPLHINFIKDFTIIFDMKNLAKVNNSYTQEVEDETKKLIINLEEDYNAIIENIGHKYLNFILQKDINFFNDTDSKNEFSYFLTTQYMRTKQLRNSISRTLENNKLVDIKKIWPIMAHIFATNLGYSLASSKKNKIILIENRSSTKFITGDQPVINTFAYNKNIDEEVLELELYYPVSPDLAILITEKDYQNNTLVIDDNNEINKYNTMIFQLSEEQIYASSECELKMYNKTLERNSLP